MPDQELAGNLLLVTDPSSPTTPLSVSRTDKGTPSPLAQVSMFGAGTNNLQGALTFSTMNSGAATGPLVERMRIHTNGNVGIGTTSPAEKLEVRGAIKLHADGSLYAPGASENLRIVRGTVMPAGTIAGGKAFSVVRVEEGIYEVTFQQHFADIPTVVATQHYPDGNDFSNKGGNTRDNCVIIAVSAAKARIKCGDGNGNASDRRFEFIALGPR